MNVSEALSGLIRTKKVSQNQNLHYIIFRIPLISISTLNYGFPAKIRKAVLSRVRKVFHIPSSSRFFEILLSHHSAFPPPCSFAPSDGAGVFSPCLRPSFLLHRQTDLCRAS